LASLKSADYIGDRADLDPLRRPDDRVRPNGSRKRQMMHVFCIPAGQAVTNGTTERLLRCGTNSGSKYSGSIAPVCWTGTCVLAPSPTGWPIRSTTATRHLATRSRVSLWPAKSTPVPSAQCRPPKRPIPCKGDEKFSWMGLEDRVGDHGMATVRIGVPPVHLFTLVYCCTRGGRDDDHLYRHTVR